MNADFLVISTADGSRAMGINVDNLVILTADSSRLTGMKADDFATADIERQLCTIATVETAGHTNEVRLRGLRESRNFSTFFN